MISLNIIRWLWFTLMTLMTFMTFLTLFIFFWKGKEKTASIVLHLGVATGFSIELHSLPELLELLESWAADEHRIYTIWKVDGTTPMSLGLSWPLTKPPFGSCAIYFHHSVLLCKSEVHQNVLWFNKNHGLWKFQTIAVLQSKNHGSSIFLFLSRRCCAYFASKPSRCLLRVNTHFHSEVSAAYATNAEMKSSSTNPLYKGSPFFRIFDSLEFICLSFYGWLFRASLPIDPTPKKTWHFQLAEPPNIQQENHPATWLDDEKRQNPHLPRGDSTGKNDCVTSFSPVCWHLQSVENCVVGPNSRPTPIDSAEHTWRERVGDGNEHRALTKRSQKSPKRSHSTDGMKRKPKLTTTELGCIKTLVFVVR